MKRILLSVAFLLLQAFCGISQDASLTDIWSAGGRYNDTRWNSLWISSPDADDSYDVMMFRRTLRLSDAPGRFVVNVSADNRYKLYVNGTFVCDGPCKGDAMNWSFETIDIAPWLRAGENVVAAVVWNFGKYRPVAVMSMNRTAFLLQGDTEKEHCLNTGEGWKVLRCPAYSPKSDNRPRGYYAVGCTDRVDFSKYPWGWLDAGFDDSAWLPASKIAVPAAKGAGDYPNWQLVPRPLPPMERTPLDFGRELSGVTVPAGCSREFVLDGGALTTGYPALMLSGGKGAEVSISYSESFYEYDDSCGAPKKYAKGDRRVREGKFWNGYSDIIFPDGGESRLFEPLWWRTWRYMKVSVRTAAEPLVINSLTAESSMYPFELESSFSAPGNPELDRILEIGWRTARLCAHETYMDCPYFEQLQYFGDSRIQQMVTIYNTRDSALPRRLLEFGKMSMSPEGFTSSRYPANVIQLISPYSLAWIFSCRDWWMFRGDEDFLRTLLPPMRTVLGTFASFAGEDGCLRRVPFWNFADWAGLHNGTFPVDSDGCSAYMDLFYLIALRYASEMERAFGSVALAEEYCASAAKLTSAVRARYWSESRRYFADNGDRTDFSQHTNALAIIAGVVTGDEASDLFRRLFSDADLRPVTIYFNYYLQEAMAVSGNAGMLLDNLGVLRDQMALGLTTWAEMPEPSRSDCHAWGSSPNIEFFRMLLGIDSAAPGFSEVRIEPSLCNLKEVSGSIPHPKGTVSVSYRVSDSVLDAEITLPEGVGGEFVWKGTCFGLRSGVNRFGVRLQN